MDAQGKHTWEDTRTQGQFDPSKAVSQITASQEAMKSLQEALLGSIVSSIQAVGIIPSSQP